LFAVVCNGFPPAPLNPRHYGTIEIFILLLLWLLLCMPVFL